MGLARTVGTKWGAEARSDRRGGAEFDSHFQILPDAASGPWVMDPTQRASTPRTSRSRVCCCFSSPAHRSIRKEHRLLDTFPRSARPTSLVSETSSPGETIASLLALPLSEKRPLCNPQSIRDRFLPKPVSEEHVPTQGRRAALASKQGDVQVKIRVAETIEPWMWEGCRPRTPPTHAAGSGSPACRPLGSKDPQDPKHKESTRMPLTQTAGFCAPIVLSVKENRATAHLSLGTDVSFSLTLPSLFRPQLLSVCNDG